MLRTVRFILAIALSTTPLYAATFTVSSLGDAGPDTLRAAITNANADAVRDTIEFSVAGTILIATPLPDIVNPVDIDASTAPGWIDAPVVALEDDPADDSPGPSAVTEGLVFETGSDTSTVFGLELRGFLDGGDGTGAIALRGGDDIFIAGCYFGNITGGQEGNHAGIFILTSGHLIGGSTPEERNVFAGDVVGIQIREPGGSTEIIGNYIGVDPAGVPPPTPNTVGILLEDASDNLVGCTVPEERNIISGHSSDGILFATLGGTPSTNNLITGNYIGTNVAGDAALGNSNGVTLGGEFNFLGGFDPGEINVISGNDNSGVVFGVDSTGSNVVTNNYIGLNAAGDAAVPNTTGVSFNDIVGGHFLGDPFGFSNNVISGNREGGVVVGSSDQFIIGNIIGLDPTATAVIPNSYGIDIFSGGGNFIFANIVSGNDGDGVTIPGDGIIIRGEGNTTIVGGTFPGEGNLISNNAGAGVVVGDLQFDNSIRGNTISGNGGIGIDLSAIAILFPPTGDGVTPNDPDDPDDGANDLQNFPTLTTAITGATQTDVSGTLDSTPSTTFDVDVYADGAYLGSFQTTTNASGDATFNETIAAGSTAGASITATATNPTGSTSELSAAVAAAAFGELQFSAPTYSFGEAGLVATITVTRTGGSAGTVTVEYATSPGSATAPADYTHVTNTLTFISGDTSETFDVPIVNDGMSESSETVNLTLSNPGGGASLGAQSTAVLSILDDDSSANLGIVKTASSPQVTVGNPFSYTLAVSNAGATTATNVVVTDSLPAGIAYISSSATQGTTSFNAGVVTANLGAIANGGTASVTIIVRATQAGMIENTATVASPEDSTPTNNSSPATINATGSGGAPTLNEYALIALALLLALAALRGLRVT